MRKEHQAKVFIITAMLIWGTIGIFRRYIPIPSSLLACLRGLIGAVFLMMVLLVRKKKIHDISLNKIILLAVVGCLIGLNWMMLFEAYNYTSIAVATLCYYMQPTFLILISPLLFKEQLSSSKLLCAMVSLVGMIMVSGVFENHMVNNIKGSIYGLSAAVLYTTVIVLNKKITDMDVYVKTMIQLLFAGLIMIPYLLITKTPISIPFNGTNLFLIGVVGFVHTGLAYVLYFSSIENIDSQSIGLLSYIDPISALFFSAVLLNEKLSLLGIIGAILILGSMMFCEKRRK